MPYIPPAERRGLGVSARAAAPGQLNYQFSDAIAAYLDRHGLSYQTINDVVGALEGAKLEFYRRIAAPYEEVKRAAHGDVYSR